MKQLLLIFAIAFALTASAQTKIVNITVYKPLTSTLQVQGKDSVYNLFVETNDSLRKATLQIVALQNQISNIVIPPGAGIPPPNIQTGSYTIRTSDYNTDIYMKCNGCAIYVPQGLTPGFKCVVTNYGPGTVNIRQMGEIRFTAGSVYSLSRGSQSREIKYIEPLIVNVR